VAVPFIDLKTQYQKNKSKVDAAIHKVLDHGSYIMGPEVTELEKQLSDYLGVKHTLACSSGTDALVLPLMSYDLKEGDAVFTSPFTFFASAESISLAGATPVFVDIDPDTYNLDATALKDKIEDIIAEGKLTPKGIIPVDLFGIAADYNAIAPIAEQYNLFLLEDAAQSFGAPYRGKRAGGMGDCAATSFYPAKPLGCYGDGGATFTNDTALYEELVSLRVHGQAMSGNKYDNVRIGLNARMDSIQAAILLEKLKFYDQEIEMRNHVADRYTSLLDGSVKTPHVPNGQGSVWAQYTVQSNNRDNIRSTLQENGIPTAVFYPTPIHLSTAYKHLGHNKGDFPVSEAAAERVFSLPMHPYLTNEEITLITDTVKRATDS